MDPRIYEHAEVIVDHSTDVREGDDVVIRAPTVADDLVVALHELIGERGANPSYSTRSARAQRAFRRASDPDDFELGDHVLAMVEECDVFIRISGSENTYEQSDVAPEKNTAFGEAYQELQRTVMEKRWVDTHYPATGDAQNAEMSTEAYEEFVWNTINKDWEAQKEHQRQLVEILDSAEEVRIVSGDETDVTMSVAGMIAVNDYGEGNLPGGEVFTAPVTESVEGEVLFDKPLMIQGQEVQDVHLTFEDGEVTEYSTEKNEGVLDAILETDEGARRLGELGFGMNRDIDRFTYNTLFDEKMGDTIHMALGQAIGKSVPDDREANESAIHTDMIVDMSEDSFVEFDGEVVQRNGTFVFEDGFGE